VSEVIESFIARWQGVTASELATAQSFVIGLYRLLDLPELLATLGRARRLNDGRWTVGGVI